MLNPTEKVGEYARKHNGNYLLGHFAEGNELERASSVVLTVYSDDALKILYQAKVGLIKNRDGTPIEFAFETVIEPEYYTFGNKLVNIDLGDEYNGPTLEEVLGGYAHPPAVELDYGVEDFDWGV